jgi:HEAT repeat protein
MIFDKLITDLLDNDHRVRKSAVEALGKLDNMKAVGPLIEALKDMDLFIRCQAAMALKKLTNQNFGNDYEMWKAWWSKNKL